MLKLWLDLFRQIPKKEKIFFYAVSIGVLFLTLLPLFAGLLLKPAGYYYTGSGFLAGADKMVYFSMIEEAKQGNFLLHNLYNSDLKDNGMVSPLWFLLGGLARLSGVSTLFVFHFFRIIFGFILLWLFYLFLTRVFNDARIRRTAFLLYCFASGAGFLFAGYLAKENLFEWLPVDFWVAEGHGFLTLIHSPLFILSQLFILAIFWWAIERLGRAGWAEAMLVGLAVMILGLFHPYDILIVVPVLGVWYVVKCVRQKRFFKKVFFKLAIIGLWGLSSVGYFLWLKAHDPAFAGWAEQNITPSPKLINYLIGYGLPLVFYLFGIKSALKSKNEHLFFLGLWTLTATILIFAPFRFQTRMTNGWFMAIAAIGAAGFFNLIDYLKDKAVWRFSFIKYAAGWLAAILLAGTNLYIVFAEITVAAEGFYPTYVSGDYKKGLDWLKTNVKNDEAVFSSRFTGNLLPAFTGKRVFIGHGHQTADWDVKKFFNEWFFASNDYDKAKAQKLKEANVDYLFWSPIEQRLGLFNPYEKSYLTEVFRQGEVSIFKIQLE